jgi:hypothetical protein
LSAILFVSIAYIYTAELLHKHYEESTLRSATIAAYTKELLPGIAAFALSGFNFDQLVCVVHISRSLDLVLPKTTERSERFVEFAFLHVPIDALA